MSNSLGRVGKVKKITKWSVITNDGKIKHNHIEDGWVKGDFPQPIKKEYTNQKAWEKLSWIRTVAYLDDQNRVVLK